MDIVVTCLQSRNDAVVASALAATEDLLHAFGDALVRFLHAEEDSRSLLVQLLRLAVSHSRPKRVRAGADGALRFAAARLHQASVVALLEVLCAQQPGRRQAKAKALLLIATYRLS